MNDVCELVAGARNGRNACIARLLSIVENDESGAADVIRATYRHTGRATLVGITGAPGTGKSTLVSQLAAAYRRAVARVAVVAVDPSSPYTGGAILGDRIRMRDRYLDAGVFIRSMANRGNMGGLARATRRVVGVLDALGFDVVLVETVGVGQQEVGVVRVVDTVCLLTIPGAGDDIQAIKAGVMEIADVLVVNKSDHAAVDEAVLHLRQSLELATARSGWRIPIVKTSALHGTGIDDLIDAIEKHKAWALETGEKSRRSFDSIRDEIGALLQNRVLRDLAARIGERDLDDVVKRVASKTLDPYAAVDVLLGSEARPRRGPDTE